MSSISGATFPAAVAAGIDPSRFVFLDETGAKHLHESSLTVAPHAVSFAWSTKVPLAHWQMTTLVAGIRGDGVVAPFALTGAMDGLTFESYVEQILKCRACAPLAIS